LTEYCGEAGRGVDKGAQKGLCLILAGAAGNLRSSGRATAIRL
jgi:hypothetical protein